MDNPSTAATAAIVAAYTIAVHSTMDLEAASPPSAIDSDCEGSDSYSEEEEEEAPEPTSGDWDEWFHSAHRASMSGSFERILSLGAPHSIQELCDALRDLAEQAEALRTQGFELHDCIEEGERTGALGRDRAALPAPAPMRSTQSLLRSSSNANVKCQTYPLAIPHYPGTYLLLHSEREDRAAAAFFATQARQHWRRLGGIGGPALAPQRPAAALEQAEPCPPLDFASLLRGARARGREEAVVVGKVVRSGAAGRAVAEFELA